jgi:hypothetical protein
LPSAFSRLLEQLDIDNKFKRMETGKDWAARFEKRAGAFSSIRQALTKEAAAVAGAYWGLVLAASVVLRLSGADMIGTGALPIAALTVPWSLLAIAVGSSATPDQLSPLVSPLGTFIVFPVLCGGLNAVLIVVAWSAIRRRRRHNG